MRETGQQASRNLGKCPKCGKSTPIRSGSCLYCGAMLEGVQPHAHVSSDKILEEPRQLGAGTGGARHQKVYDGRAHYLFLGAREPIQLEADKLFLIGRDPHASLVIHSLEVSRQHCEIDWRGDPARPMILEVRARNGTFVNDRPLRRGEPEPLRDRDVIRLGRDFELLYRQLDERELKETLTDLGRADTRAIRLAPPAPAAAPAPVPLAAPLPLAVPVAHAVPVPLPVPQPAAASLLPDTGDLSQIPGGLLLDMLHRERRSGKLTVFDGQTAGEIVLGDGRAKVAIFGALQSRDALEAIAQTTRGVYKFVPDAPAPLPLPIAAPPAAATAGIPPELIALYQAQLGAGAAPAARPLEPAARSLPPELAGLFAAAAASAVAAAQQHAPYPPQAAPPSPPPQPRHPTQPLGGPAHVSPIRGASEPTAAQIAAILGERAGSPPGGPLPPGSSTASRPRSGEFKLPPPSGHRSPDPLKPPTQQMHADAKLSSSGQWKTAPSPSAAPPGSKTGQRARSDVQPVKSPSESSRGRSQAAEPLKTPTDPYVGKTAPPPTPPTSAYAPPAASSNGDSPEAREANVLLSTVRAVGLTGEGLGAFVGDTMAKLLDDGKIAIAIELGERGLALADKGNFEAALATRVAFKAALKTAPRTARILELVEKVLAAHGPALAAHVAQRTLALIDPEVPPDPRDNTPLGRLAAIAKK